MIWLSLTSRVKVVISHSENAHMPKPKAIMMRASKRPIRRDTSIIEIIMPAPRGASTTPVVNTG